MQTKQKHDKFPELCCGVCAFGKYKGKQYYCWESPPALVTEDGVVEFKRGFPVETIDIACSSFKPRCHS